MTLGRLERAGLVASDRAAGIADRPERKVYDLTPRDATRGEWLADVGWPKPDLTDFHLKLVAAAAARLADPLSSSSAASRADPSAAKHTGASMEEPDGSRSPCCWKASCSSSGRPSLARGLRDSWSCGRMRAA